MSLGLGPRQLCAVQETACIVIDQAIQPELLRGTLVKKLLQPAVAWLAIPEQLNDLLWVQAVKDRLTDIPVKGIGVNCHAATAAFSPRLALYATVIDRT